MVPTWLPFNLTFIVIVHCMKDIPLSLTYCLLLYGSPLHSLPAYGSRLYTIDYNLYTIKSNPAKNLSLSVYEIQKGHQSVPAVGCKKTFLTTTGSRFTRPWRPRMDWRRVAQSPMRLARGSCAGLALCIGAATQCPGAGAPA